MMHCPTRQQIAIYSDITGRLNPVRHFFEGLEFGDLTRGGRIEAVAPPSPREVAGSTGEEPVELNLTAPAEVSADAISQWIENNYRRYTGDATFLAGPTER